MAPVTVAPVDRVLAVVVSENNVATSSVVVKPLKPKFCMRDKLEQFLKENDVSDENIVFVVSFFLRFSHTVREQMFGIMYAHPDQLPFFLELMKKKHAFSEEPTRESAEQILTLEKNMLEQLVAEAES